LVTSVSYLFCIIKYSGVPLPALRSKQWLESSGNALLMKFSKQKNEIEVTKIGQYNPLFHTVHDVLWP